MKFGACVAVAAIGIALTGCATIFEGTSQEITVNTNPSGASCVFLREGSEVGRIGATPGTANIRKSKYDITIACEKPGFARATYLNHSGTTATIAANVAADLILTAGISSIVDSADGADNKYDSAVNISLTPLGASSASAAGSITPATRTTAAAETAIPVSTGSCSHEQEVQARLAAQNGYTGGPKCN